MTIQRSLYQHSWPNGGVHWHHQLPSAKFGHVYCLILSSASLYSGMTKKPLLFEREKVVISGEIIEIMWCNDWEMYDCFDSIIAGDCHMTEVYM